MSGGEKQRLAVARVLYHNPRYLQSSVSIRNYWIAYAFGYLRLGPVSFIGTALCISFVGFVMRSFSWDRYAVLDECTSAVSADGEENLYKNLRGSGITLLSIAHRPALKK